jgi:CDP-diacylglycerol--glycerol-3-phosphate 3-phosphatidyltransferase
MPSVWQRITAGHIRFVTTGYLRLMDPIATLLIKLRVSANALTTLGTVATVVGGIAFGMGHMRVGGVIVAITAIADALDGIVARRTGQVSIFGAFYDSVLDRVADGALLAGVAFFYANNPVHRNVPMLGITLVGMIGTYMVSYTRARAEALGINAKVGVMQRAERVALLAGPQALFGLAFDGWILAAVVTVLATTAWITACQRINFVRRSSEISVPTPLRVLSESATVHARVAARRAES